MCTEGEFFVIDEASTTPDRTDRAATGDTASRRERRRAERTKAPRTGILNTGRLRGSLSATVLSTVPIVLASSIAVGVGLAPTAGATEQAAAERNRGDLAKALRGAVALGSNALASTSPVANRPANVPAQYTVQPGDTVSSIATQYGLSTASVLALNGLGWKSIVFAGQVLKLSRAAATPVLDRGSDAGVYVIARGDTIRGIAASHGVSVQAILAANGLRWSSIVYPGQSLTIPARTAGTGSTFGRSDSRVAESVGVLRDLNVATAQPETQTAVVVDEPADAAEPETAETAVQVETPASGLARYTIKSGDTLASIAAAHGTTVSAILSANSLTISSVIYAGRVIAVPGSGSVSQAAATPVASKPATPAPTQSAAPAPTPTQSAAPAPTPTQTTAPSTGSPGPTAPGVTPMSSEMRGNARVIVDVGRSLGVSDYGIVIALATAMQESSLRNIAWGDLDSVGLFQQRPSSGWGSAAQLLDPAHAARLFYGGPSNPNRGNTRGLLDVGGWQNMTVTQAAQAVQISAYPDAYAKWETSARAWLAELG